MLSLTWGGNHGTPEQRWPGRKRSFTRMLHFPEASLLAVLLLPLSGPLAHDLSAFSFQQVSQILLSQEESLDWLTVLSSTGVDLNWNFKMWLYYYPFFFLLLCCLVTPRPLGLLKKGNYVGFTKAAMIDAGIWSSSPLRPLTSGNHIPKQGRAPGVHFPSDGPTMISGHQDNSKLFQAEVVKNGNGK